MNNNPDENTQVSPASAEDAAEASAPARRSTSLRS